MIARSIKPRMSSNDRRDQILQAAIETFARQGFAGTKTRDIASAAGVSEAVVFRHFSTKEKLYHAILDTKESDHHLEYQAKLTEYAQQRNDALLLRYLTKGIFESFRKDPAFHRLMLYATLEGHLLSNLFRERLSMPVGGFLKRYVVLRQKEGAFRKCDPEVMISFIFSTSVQWAMGRYLFKTKVPRMDEDTLVSEIVDLIMGGLLKGQKKHHATK